MKTRVILATAVACALSVIPWQTGCNSFGRRDRGEVFSDSQFTPTRAQAEDRLREIVRGYIMETGTAQESHHAPVIRRRPYFFREYVVYPDGPDVFEVEFREVDSRIRPLLAEVKINKIRYSTRMHRKHDRAEADRNFLRDTGEETLVYEWRSGRWTLTSTFFNAHKTEEMIAGEWQPRRDETLRVIPEEDQPGWFGRVWQRIRGAD